MARARSTAIYAGTPTLPLGRVLAADRRPLSICGRGFPRHHRRHGDGCRARHPRAEPRRARSLLRPRRQRGRAALGAHFRRRQSRPPIASRIISAARCSSPTSCAISPRMPSAAGSICRAICWSTHGIIATEPDDRAASSARSARCATTLAEIAEQHFAEARGGDAACSRRAMRPARGDGRGLSRLARAAAPARLAAVSPSRSSCRNR